MQIKIADVDKTPFWGIPEADIHLSSEDNKFVEIDYSVLTPFQQQTVFTALRMGTIEAEGQEQFEVDFRNMLKGYLEKRQEQQFSDIRKVFGVEQPADQESLQAVEKAEELKKVMKGSVSTLKRTLPDYPATDLEVAMKIEQHGKNRKTVISLIDELISKQAQKSVSKIENPNAPTPEEYEKRQIFSGKERLFLSNLTDVRESEQEQITIPIGVDPSVDDDS